MTNEEQNGTLGKAVREYSDNKGKIACLMHRLANCQRAVSAFIENPDNTEAQEGVQSLNSDPRQDARDLLKLRDAQSRLRDLFRAQNLDID